MNISAEAIVSGAGVAASAIITTFINFINKKSLGQIDRNTDDINALKNEINGEMRRLDAQITATEDRIRAEVMAEVRRIDGRLAGIEKDYLEKREFVRRFAELETKIDQNYDATTKRLDHILSLLISRDGGI